METDEKSAGGKPITPTEEKDLIRNGNRNLEENCSGAVIETEVNQINKPQNQSALNGTKSTNVHAAIIANTSLATDSNGSSLAQVSKKVVPGPASASHIIIDEKKNSNKGCCSIQ